MEGRQSGYEEAGQRRGEKGKHGGGQVSPQGWRGEEEEEGWMAEGIRRWGGRKNKGLYEYILSRCIICTLLVLVDYSYCVALQR